MLTFLASISAIWALKGDDARHSVSFDLEQLLSTGQRHLSIIDTLSLLQSTLTSTSTSFAIDRPASGSTSRPLSFVYTTTPST